MTDIDPRSLESLWQNLDVERSARHEASHAVYAWLYSQRRRDAPPVHWVSINPRRRDFAGVVDGGVDIDLDKLDNDLAKYSLDLGGRRPRRECLVR